MKLIYTNVIITYTINIYYIYNNIKYTNSNFYDKKFYI